MRILFFSHYYPPEVNAPASRTSEHCKAWVRAGHDVTVVTCAPNHPQGRLYPGYRNRLYQIEVMDGVRVVRVWTYLAANEGFLKRTLNYVSYMVGAALALPRLARPDVIVSTSPQFFCGLTGMLARLVLRAPWVLEIRDIWPESIVTVGAMRKGWGVRGLEALERRAYRSADAIVAVTDSFVPHIAARCGTAAKIAVIKNGVDLALFDRSADRRLAKGKLGLDGKFVAAYVGTHGMAHGLGTILTAAEATRDRHDIVYLLVGDGAERKRLQAEAAARGLANVRFLGQLPKADMPAVWAATDASLILLKRNPLFKKVLPSKLFEAMAMGCPVVLGVEGEAAALLAHAQAGCTIVPEDAGQLVAAVTRLAADPALAAAMGSRGAAYVREHFDRDRLAARYLDVLGAVTGRASVPVSTTAGDVQFPRSDAA